MVLKLFFFSFAVLSFSYAKANQEIFETILTSANPAKMFKSHLFQKLAYLDKKQIAALTGLKENTFGHNFIGTSDPCALAINQIIMDIPTNKTYALKMLDSWGKLESGFFQLNTKWLGRFYECEAVVTEKFSGKYFATTFTAKSGLAISIGTCFPDSCSVSNITNLLDSVTQRKFAVNVTTPQQVAVSAPVSILGIFWLCVLGTIVLAASLYDGCISYYHKKNELKACDPSNEPQSAGSESIITKIIISFSAIENTKRLFNTEQKPGNIHCLHGIRFISIMWVILGHSALAVMSYIDNLMFLADYFLSSWTFQAITNGTFSVDTFFFLSGLLVVYLGLKELHRRQGKINILLMYLYRYLRLTPAYAFVILMLVSIYPLVGTGPTWFSVSEPTAQLCKQYWWTNILYINNLHPSDMQKECFAWGWYLANDMQFYLLTPIFLLLLYRWPKVGISLLAFVTVCSIAITGAFSRHTNQQPQIFGFAGIVYYIKAIFGGMGEPPHYSLQSEALNGLSNDFFISDLYSKPWCRICSYLVGMATGYLLFVQGNEMKMRKIFVFMGWFFAAFINLSVIFGLFPTIHEMQYLNVNLAAFYNAVSRPAWCLGLAWVTFACVNGYGGYINAFLSWKAFIPLSRLTYCLYLVHPLVIYWLFFTSETLYHCSIHLVIMLYTGSLCVSAVLAYFVHLLVEAPCTSLVKLLTGKEKIQSKLAVLKLSSTADDQPLLANQEQNGELCEA